MISPPLQIFSKGSKLIFGVAGLLVVGLFGVPLSHAQTQADEARLAARVDGDGQLSPFLSFPGGTVALEDNAETSAEGSAVSTASALPPALVGLLANTTTVATPAMAT